MITCTSGWSRSRCAGGSRAQLPTAEVGGGVGESGTWAGRSELSGAWVGSGEVGRRAPRGLARR